MEQLAISRESGPAGATAIFRLNGPLTLATLFTLQEALREAGDCDTVIDVNESPYIDSAGLGTILSHWSHTQRTGHRFALTGVTPRIRVLLEITKVDAILPMFATPEEADRAFTGLRATRA